MTKSEFLRHQRFGDLTASRMKASSRLSNLVQVWVFKVFFFPDSLPCHLILPSVVDQLTALLPFSPRSPPFSSSQETLHHSPCFSFCPLLHTCTSWQSFSPHTLALTFSMPISKQPHCNVFANITAVQPIYLDLVAVIVAFMVTSDSKNTAGRILGIIFGSKKDLSFWTAGYSCQPSWTFTVKTLQSNSYIIKIAVNCLMMQLLRNMSVLCI